MSITGHLVVAGTGIAGLRAAKAARNAGFRGQITLLGAEPCPPYDRLCLSKKALTPDGLAARPDYPDLPVDDPAIEVWLDTSAVSLQAGEGTLVVRRPSGEQMVAFDALVIATGSTPIGLPGLPANPASGVTGLRTWQDAQAVRAGLERGGPVVVLGSGFIGAEVASAARARDLPVTIVEAASHPLARVVGPEASELICQLHQRAGTTLLLGQTVVEASGQPLRSVTLDDGRVLPATLLILGVGTRPATGWLAAKHTTTVPGTTSQSIAPTSTGVVELAADHCVITDAAMQSSVPGIFAAGDLARTPNPLADGDGLLTLPHWTSAAEQGARAGRNAAAFLRGEPLESGSEMPTFWSEWYGHRLQVLGTTVGASPEIVDRGDQHATVLYHQRERVCGVLMINGQRIMKLAPLLRAGADIGEVRSALSALE